LLHALQRQYPKNMVYGTHVEVDYNLTLQYFHSRVDSNTLTMGLGTGQWAPLYAGIFKQSMGARNRAGIGLSYRPARPHRLAEFIPWNQFLGSINV